jgi:hypothetical protein
LAGWRDPEADHAQADPGGRHAGSHTGDGVGEPENGLLPGMLRAYSREAMTTAVAAGGARSGAVAVLAPA